MRTVVKQPGNGNPPLADWTNFLTGGPQWARKFDAGAGAAAGGKKTGKTLNTDDRIDHISFEGFFKFARLN